MSMPNGAARPSNCAILRRSPLTSCEVDLSSRQCGHSRLHWTIGLQQMFQGKPFSTIPNIGHLAATEASIIRRPLPPATSDARSTNPEQGSYAKVPLLWSRSANKRLVIGDLSTAYVSTSNAKVLSQQYPIGALDQGASGLPADPATAKFQISSQSTLVRPKQEVRDRHLAGQAWPSRFGRPHLVGRSPRPALGYDHTIRWDHPLLGRHTARIG